MPSSPLPSPAVNPEQVVLPAKVSFHDTSEMSRNEDDGDSCMDLCSSNSDDSVSIVTKKRSPVNMGLQHKLKIAKGIFGTTPKKESIDLSSGEVEVERSLKRLKRPRNYKVFDQVYHAGRDESYDRRPIQPSMLLLSPGSKVSSSIENVTEWTECGVFSSMQNKSKDMPLTDVLPAFSPSELSFFTDMQLYNVDDLKRANTNGLSIHLFESLNFRKACAFYAWKDDKPLCDYLRFTVARNTVMKWKKSLVQQISNDAAKIQSVNKKNNAESNKQIMSPAESTEKENDVENTETTDIHLTSHLSNDEENINTEADDTEAKDVPLTSLLSNEEVRILRDHCGIETATQLINAGPNIKQTLSGIMASQFDGRSLREIECICEGMLYSWVLRSREAVDSTESSATTMDTEASDSCATISERQALLSSEDEQTLRPTIETPLSYVDYLFFEQEGISTDQELSLIDPSLLTRQYTAFLHAKGKDISHVDANKQMKRLRHGASLVLSGVSHVVSSSQTTRLDLSKLPKGVMLSASNLCKTTIDKNNNGLPKKTLIVYDDQNKVLYEFLVSISESNILDSGKGAFLTFKGAKELKKDSQIKSRNSAKSHRTPVTRNPREALFAFSGATVTLKGTNIHGDEHHYEMEKDDSVGIWNEYTLDDFVEPDSNITFSSMHVGCALIELDRYAPVVKADRKTEFIFGMKDFLFAHEPASWRFDVAEKLNGQNQVVDFTDDTTGSPHASARANTAMYVNECGHDTNLVENVCSLETCRSVSYYIYIDRPMEAGETRELLINYREKYEDIRERRGYGLVNIHDGVKGDDDDVSRVLRNQKERLPTEATIMSCSEEEIRMLVNFISERVLGGVIGATSQVPIGTDTDVLARQYVARRRIHWMSKLCERRLLELTKNQEDDSPSEDFCVAFVSQHLFILQHRWMDQNDPRPPYKGLSTILSITKDQFDRDCFELSLPKGKYLTNVPAAVVTMPEDCDFENAPQRLRVNHLKSNRDRHLPRVRSELLKDLSSMEWKISSLIQHLPNLSKSVQKSLMWEVAEEILFKATPALSDPPKEILAKFARVIETDDLAKTCSNNFTSFYDELCTIAGQKHYS
eukprot:scaffold11236_cov211-Skeletonema_marinoi.AAC.2